jgi:hypothetical protein
MRAAWVQGMNSYSVYADKLVEITDGEIPLRYYYFPFGSKRVKFSEIDHVVAKEPTLLNGKWRIWGTGDFRTWFPFDASRPSRDKIFVVSFANKRQRIGFTVEDSNRVQEILRNKGLIVEEPKTTS